MLCLTVPSQQQWIDAACGNLDQLLIDHAHCEKKAATNAFALISRYPDRSELVRRLSELVLEETEHFIAVHKLLCDRGLTLTRDPGDEYAKQLHKHIRGNEPDKLMDSLLVAALIEARSCERFSLLSQHVDDEQLRAFYSSLLASEAGHYTMFTDIAREYFDSSMVRLRLQQLTEFEAAIIMNLYNSPSMHG